MPDHIFSINNTELTVTADYGQLFDILETLRGEWMEGCYTEAFTTEHGNVKEIDFLGDIDDMERFIKEIQADPFVLKEYVKKVRKKKNGKFWSNSGVTIRSMEHVSTYFTDFTNAWSVYQLRIEVWTENTAKLVLHSRTETF